MQLVDGLTFLSVLNLSLNQLVGPIPCVKQFGTFLEASYVLEILEDCIVFLNEKIYISALYRRHKYAVQVKCSTSISVLYK